MDARKVGDQGYLDSLSDRIERLRVKNFLTTTTLRKIVSQS